MRPLFALFALALAPMALCDTSYLGMYLQNTKVGYAKYSTTKVTLNGRPIVREDSKTVLDAGLLGTALSMQITSSTWTDSKGRPIRMTFRMSSSGRAQTVDARFGAKIVTLNVENSGQRSTRTLAIPVGNQIVDDPLTLVVNGAMKPGATRSFFVLDPMTVSFVKNEVKFIGKSQTQIKGKSVSATQVDVTDPRATMSVFLAGNGELIKVDGPMGIEMIPISKTLALEAPGKYFPSVDLAYATSIKTDKPIDDPASLAELKLRISGPDLSRIPSDEHQTVSRTEDGWTVDVHPVSDSEAGQATLSAARMQRPAWTKPSLDMPADSTAFVALAHRISGRAQTVGSASRAIQQWVYKNMTPNAGIGVLRDATEVLKTKEGVCRDYAILTTTLLRADGIPARLASGLVNWDGSFYYHAWAEAWDGRHWIGIDSTTDDPQISAAHVKLADGNVDSAFTFTFLNKARIEVLGTRKE